MCCERWSRTTGRQWCCPRPRSRPSGTCRSGRTFPAVSLVPQEAALRNALRRVNYQWLVHPKLAWDDVAQRLAGGTTGPGDREHHSRCPTAAPEGAGGRGSGSTGAASVHPHVRCAPPRGAGRGASPAVRGPAGVADLHPGDRGRGGCGLPGGIPALWPRRRPSRRQPAGRTAKADCPSWAASSCSTRQAGGPRVGSTTPPPSSPGSASPSPRSSPTIADALDVFYANLYTSLLPGGESGIYGDSQDARTSGRSGRWPRSSG